MNGKNIRRGGRLCPINQNTKRSQRLSKRIIIGDVYGRTAMVLDVRERPLVCFSANNILNQPVELNLALMAKEIIG
jgi:hypothetical protein